MSEVKRDNQYTGILINHRVLFIQDFRLIIFLRLADA